MLMTNWQEVGVGGRRREGCVQAGKLASAQAGKLGSTQALIKQDHIYKGIRQNGD